MALHMKLLKYFAGISPEVNDERERSEIGMKRIKVLSILVIVFLICGILIALNIERHKTATREKVPINETLSNTTDFAVSSVSSDVYTSINGTVFVYKKDEGDYYAQIVASFEIDPKDWGGIAIYFPEGILVTNIDCSYPQEVSLQEKTHNGYYDYADVAYSFRKNIIQEWK